MSGSDRRGPCAVLVCALCCAAPAALAASPETLIVTGTRFPGAPSATPSAVTVLDREAIDASLAPSVYELLRGRAGLQVSDLYGDGSETALDARGFGARAAQNVLVLIDGRRLNNADDGEPDLSLIDLKDVERVEVLQGGAGVLYGDQAVGAVINVVTARPGPAAHGVELGLGSYGRRRLQAHSSARLSGGAGYRLAAAWSGADNYRANNARERLDVLLAIDRQRGEHRWFAEAQHVAERQDLPGALFLDQLAADRRAAQNPGDTLDGNHDLLRLGLARALGADWQALGEISGRWDHERGRISVAGRPASLDLRRRVLEATPRLQRRFSTAHGSGRLTLGADLSRVDYRLHSQVAHTRNTQEQLGAYAHLALPLRGDLEFGAGARHARVANDISFGSSFTGIVLPRGSRLRESLWMGGAGLNWRISDALRGHLRVEQNYRFPNADEYAGIAGFNVFPFPAPLPMPRPQRGLTIDGGLAYDGEAIEARAGLWRLQLADEIAFDGVTLQSFNAGDSRRYGATLEVRWRPAPDLTFDASYAYIDGAMTGGPFEGAEPSAIARHSGRLALGWRARRELTGTLELIGLGPRSYAGDFANVLPPLPGYLVLNLALRWHTERWTAGLRVGNLLDRRYSDAGALGFDFRSFAFPVQTRYPAPGRNVDFTLAYRFGRQGTSASSP